MCYFIKEHYLQMSAMSQQSIELFYRTLYACVWMQAGNDSLSASRAISLSLSHTLTLTVWGVMNSRGSFRFQELIILWLAPACARGRVSL